MPILPGKTAADYVRKRQTRTSNQGPQPLAGTKSESLLLDNSLGVLLNPLCCAPVTVCQDAYLNWFGNSIPLTLSNDGITYSAPYASLSGPTTNISPIFGPPPPGIGSTMVSISNGVYTVLFPKDGSPLARQFVMSVGFIITCQNGTVTTQMQEIEFVVPQ
jgi:hypothetical protein